MSRYIDADFMEKHYASMLINPTPDVTEQDKKKAQIIITALNMERGIKIVRCQDCKYWVYNFNGCSRNPCTEPWYATDFCNYGERK